MTCAGVLLAAMISVKLFFLLCWACRHRHCLLRRGFLPEILSGVDAADGSVVCIDVCVVNGMSACVHFYSIGYMSHDESKILILWRICLCLLFAMLML